MIGHTATGRAADQLVGRTAELGLVQDRIRDAARGSGGVLLVTGPPGIGKSALLEAAVATAPAQVFTARTDELTRRRRFGVLIDSLGGLVTSSVDEFTTGGAILDTLAARCEAGAVVLVLDDLHLADEATFAVLDRLCDRLASWPLLVLAAARSPETAVGLERLQVHAARRGLLTELHLGPLGTDVAHDLATRVAGAPLLPDVARRLRAANGNPLLLVTMLASSPSGATGDRLDATTARAVRRAAELHELSPEARDIVEIGSVLGDAFSARSLGRASHRRPDQLLSPLREARVAGVLVEDGDQLAFRSKVVQEAVYAGLAAPLRADLHRLAAATLEEDCAPGELVAEHLMQAALSAADLDLVARVATRLRSTTPVAAAELWARAAGLADATSPRRAEFAAELALAWQVAGRPDRAEPVARAALAGGAPRRLLGALLLCQSTALLGLRRWHEARDVAEQAILQAGVTTAERAEQAAVGAVAATMAGDQQEAARAVQQADRLVRSTRSSRARRSVNAAHGLLAYRRGRLLEAERLLSRATDPGRETGTAGEVGACALHAAVLGDLDRMTDARTVLATAAAAGPPSAVVALAAARGALALGSGDLGRAAAELDTCLLARPDGQPASPLHLAQRAAVALHQQGPRAAEQWLRRITGDLTPFAPELGMAWLPRVGAAIRLARGDLEGAAEQLWEGWEERVAAGAVPDLFRMAPIVVEVAERTGHRDRAAQAAALLAALSRDNPDVATLTSASLFASAVLAQDADALVTAVELSFRSPRLLDAAELATLATVRLADLGKLDLAVAFGGRATASYTSVGATYDVSQLRSWLRQAGRRAPEGARPLGGRGALTRTELIVVGHLEQGRSNAEIAREMVISRRTVETHVSHILAKLGARSRAELIATIPGPRRPAEQREPIDDHRP